MKRLFILQLLICVLLVGCTREEIGPDQNIKKFSCFSASVEEGAITKAHIQDGAKVKWDVGDCITVFSDVDSPSRFYLEEDGLFHGPEISGTKFYACYPSDWYTYDENTPLQMSVDLPKYRDASSSEMPMAAVSTGNELLFKQTGGALHFRIKSTKRISSLSVSGYGMDMVAGHGVLDFSQDTPVVELAEDDNNCSQIAYIQNFYSQGNVNEWDVYVPVPPMVFHQGIHLILDGWEEDQYYSVSRDTYRVIRIDRAQMKSFAEIDVDDALQQALEDSSEETLQEERDALISLYQALGGDHWINNTNWCSDKPVSEWYGIYVDDAGRVKNIALSDNNLNGCIPEAIGKFKKLEHLYMHSYYEKNNLSGPLPESIGDLTELKTLSLSHTGITGGLPESLRNCRKLVSLEITGNSETWDGVNQSGYMSGELPEWLGELKYLSRLNLSYNCFSGNVPESISQLHDLLTIDLSSNLLSGSLPVLDAPFLQYVMLENNLFEGSVPSEYADLMVDPATIRRCIFLFDNKLSGSLPEEITSHPFFSEYSFAFLARQKEGYGIDVSNTPIPACRHTFETLTGGKLNLGELYANSDYTMIVRYGEWCPCSRGCLPFIIKLSKIYAEIGLQTVWAHSCGVAQARDKYIAEVGLDPSKDMMIVETVSYQGGGSYDWSHSHAIWEDWCEHATGNANAVIVPMVEIVNHKGEIVFLSQERSNHYKHLPFVSSRLGLENFLISTLGDYREIGYQSVDYSSDGQAHQLQAATKGIGINMVLMGDAFSDRMIADGTYEKMMRRAMEALFSEEPYRAFRDYFNVHYVDVVSKNEEYYGETALGTVYGEGTHVEGVDSRVFQYAGRILSQDQMEDALMIVLMNRDWYAGTCYLYPPESGDYGRGPAIAYFPTCSDNGTFNGVLQHEAGGHGFAKLADEYYYDGAISKEEINEGYHDVEPYGWYPNVDFTANPSEVKWSQFITDSRYADEGIGVYEGACTYARGAFRPTDNSIMNDNTGGFNAPSRYAIWYRINKLAYGEEWNGTYEDFVAFDKSNRASTPSVRTTRSSQSQRAGSSVPLAPPVIVDKDWREWVK